MLFDTTPLLIVVDDGRLIRNENREDSRGVRAVLLLKGGSKWTQGGRIERERGRVMREKEGNEGWRRTKVGVKRGEIEARARDPPEITIDTNKCVHKRGKDEEDRNRRGRVDWKEGR